jgi:hypothetical protein
MKYFTVVLLALSSISNVMHADVLVAWDVDGVDASEIAGGAPYEFAATSSNPSGRVGGSLTLGQGVNPSTSAGQYGFKISSVDEQATLAGAISSEHFIQFTLEAEAGYRFDLKNIELKGESSSSGCDNVAILTSADGFNEGRALAPLANRQDITGGLDTDASGWGDLIDLSAPQYQEQTSINFRLYGWNSTSGSGVSYIRNLSGNDLVINGTIEAIPEPAVLGFVALTGLGALIIKRFVQ